MYFYANKNSDYFLSIFRCVAVAFYRLGIEKNRAKNTNILNSGTFLV